MLKNLFLWAEKKDPRPAAEKLGVYDCFGKPKELLPSTPNADTTKTPSPTFK